LLRGMAAGQGSTPFSVGATAAISTAENPRETQSTSPARPTGSACGGPGRPTLAPPPGHRGSFVSRVRRRRLPQRFPLCAEGLQLQLLLGGQLALVFPAPANRAVVMVLRLAGVVEPLMAQGQKERVVTEVLAGRQLLGLFQRRDRRLPFTRPVVGDAEGVPV